MADGGKSDHTRHAGAVHVIMRADAAPESAEHFAALLADHASNVRQEEPGCASYVVTRAIGAPAHFAVHARFVNWSAFKAHGETAHLERVLPQLAAQMATPVSVEIFFEV
ncbi:MAG: antibiotic biosynthesis monooxygenase [Hyphomonadaceae bacterium]|nr:antibiotic biosynthesis monooxygenase [Hyphomonadaceae bacterium]